MVELGAGKGVLGRVLAELGCAVVGLDQRAPNKHYHTEGGHVRPGGSRWMAGTLSAMRTVYCLSDPWPYDDNMNS